MLTTLLTSGSQFVAAGLERAQAYAGTCISADPDCSERGEQIHLGENPSHTINLYLHLTGVMEQASHLLHPIAVARKAPVPQPASWHPRMMVAEIFHPPMA